MTDQDKNDSQHEHEARADSLSRALDRYAELTSPTVIVSLIATALMWVIMFASPSTVAWTVNLFTAASSESSSGEGSSSILLLLALPFIFPFLTVYLIARTRHPDIEDESSIKSGMMAGYNYRTRGDRRWFIWILAGMAGALNCLLLIVVYNIR